MNPITRIETENLILRKPLAKDWEAFCAFSLSERAKYTGGPHDLGSAWRAFASELGHWDIRGYGMFTLTTKTSDLAMGMIGPWSPQDWPETEIGWIVYSDAEGKGIAFEAAKSCVTHAWTVLQWESVVSYIDPKNARSRKLAERLGAAIDPNAIKPEKYPDTLVYRHPDPRGLPA